VRVFLDHEAELDLLSDQFKLPVAQALQVDLLDCHGLTCQFVLRFVDFAVRALSK
jgi:hypothetical protein